MDVGVATGCDCGSASVSGSCRFPSGSACCCSCNEKRHVSGGGRWSRGPAGGALTACEGSASGTWSGTWSDSCSCCSSRSSRPSSAWRMEGGLASGLASGLALVVLGSYPLCGLLLIWLRLSGSFLTALVVGGLGDFSSTLTTLGEQGLEAGEKPPTASAGVPSGLKPLAFSLASARNTFLRSTSFSSCS